MAVKLDPHRPAQQALPVMAAEQDAQWPQVIKKYEEEKAAGLAVIRSLQGRIAELEINLNQAKQSHHLKEQGHEDQLFVIMQEREQLAAQLEEATQRYQNLTALVDQQLVRVQQLERQREQDTQIILAARRETDALINQLAQERGEVQRLSVLLQAAIAQVNALKIQLDQMARQMNQQQLTLANQTRLLEEMNRRPNQSPLEAVAQTTFDLFIRRPFGLFFPDLNKYD